MPHSTAPVNYKTVTLARGKHASPTDGACVMELASMLAGEPFSDRPRAVCPVIGALLRAYNDAIDDVQRQDLYRYASKVIGTRSAGAIQQRRRERFLAWADETRAQGSWWRRALHRTPVPSAASDTVDVVAARAVKALGRHTDVSHSRVLELLDELCAIGSTPEPRPVQVPFGAEPVAMPGR